MNAIRGAKIRSGAKQAVEEAEQEMHDEHLDYVDMFADLAHDDEDFDWSRISFGPNFYRTSTEQEAVRKKYSNHGLSGEERLNFRRELRSLQRRFHQISLQFDQASTPLVDTQFDDTPIFIQLFRESGLPIQTHLLALRGDHAGQVLIEDEEFQDFHSGVGVDGYSIETSSPPRVSSEFDWMFNPRDYLD